MDITIKIKERDKSNYQAFIKNDFLVGIVMNLTPEDAVGMALFMADEVVPIIKWRDHPLKQWAIKKTEASHRSGL